MHFGELLQKTKELMKEYKEKGINVGFKSLRGKYEYKNNKLERSEDAYEGSVQIFNISYQDALKLGREFNQETIIWKDKDKFILVDPFTNKKHIQKNRLYGKFNKGELELDRDDSNENSSRISDSKGKVYNRNKNTPYTFTMEEDK